MVLIYEIVFRSILSALFFILFARSLFKYFRYETGTRVYEEFNKDTEFPSIVICPWSYNTKSVNELYLDNNITIKHLKSLPSLPENVNVSIIINTYYGSKRY